MRLRTLVLSLAAAAIAATPAFADVLRLHGSTTVIANIMQPHQAVIEQHTGHELQVIGNGSGQGLTDLVAGKAEIGMISAPLDTTVKKLKKKNASFNGDDLQAHQVGETRVAFITHPSNPVTSLTMEQIAGILSGKIANWQEVGGRPQPIVIVTEAKSGGLRSMTEKEVLKGQGIVASAKEMPNATQITKVVSQMPMAFGVAASAAVNGKVKEVSTDGSVSQPLILVTRGNPTTAQQAIIDAARATGS